MAEHDYRRLTRAKSRSLFAIVSTSRSSLWLGNDHLLQIDASGYTESYKRFHFRDIQALVLCKTDTWLYLGVIFAALASLFGLIALLGGGPVVAWIFGCIAAIFALCLLFDLIAGPTSKCYLRTAVQTERLVSITRLRRARKVFDTLRPWIRNAQGELRPSNQPLEVQPIPPVISQVQGPSPSSEPVTETSSPPTQEQA
jgi:hypothetical protein